MFLTPSRVAAIPLADYVLFGGHQFQTVVALTLLDPNSVTLPIVPEADWLGLCLLYYKKQYQKKGGSSPYFFANEMGVLFVLTASLLGGTMNGKIVNPEA